MATTLRLQVTQKEIDVSGTESNLETYIEGCEFTFSTKQTFTVLSGNIYNVISFGNISSTTGIKIESDQTIVCKFNGGTEEFTIYSSMISFGDYTALSIKNNSGSTATITVELYGS